MAALLETRTKIASILDKAAPNLSKLLVIDDTFLRDLVAKGVITVEERQTIEHIPINGRKVDKLVEIIKGTTGAYKGFMELLNCEKKMDLYIIMNELQDKARLHMHENASRNHTQPLSAYMQPSTSAIVPAASQTETNPSLKEVSEEQLQCIAKEVGIQWRMLALDLHFQVQEIQAIEDKSTDVNKQSLEMLLVWKRRLPPGFDGKSDLTKALDKCNQHELVVNVLEPQAAELVSEIDVLDILDIFKLEDLDEIFTRLGLNNRDVRNAIDEEPNKPKKRAKNLLNLWRSRNSLAATRDEMIRAMMQCPDSKASVDELKEKWRSI